MCGGFSIHAISDPALHKLLGKEKIKFQPRYNARPMQHLPVMLLDEGTTRLTTALWGVKIPIRGQETLLINAKLENISSPLWRSMQPALVPANGFYEWKKNGKSRPYYFTDKKRGMFYMAGLYRDKKFVILTTVATGAVKQVHHRMPVILAPDSEKAWLNSSTALHYDNLTSWEVSDEVNSTRIDNEELIYPLKPQS